MYTFDYNRQEDMALLCSYLSMLAYEDNPSQVKWLSKFFKDYEVVSDSRKNLQYIIVKDIVNKHIFISIRGTDTGSIKEAVSDIIVSLRVWATRIEGNKVHNGYSRYGEKLKLIFDRYIEEHTEYKVVFTGHSLGGVLAKYIAIRNDRATCYTYGAPRLSDNGFENSSSSTIYSYVNNEDLIPMWYPRYYNNRKNSYYLISSSQIHGKDINIEGDRLLKPLYTIIRNTFLGTINGGLKAHSIKNYIRHISRIVKVKRKNENRRLK